MLQGALDMLILRSLVMGPAHGHTIAHAIEHGSDRVLQVEHGSLYPALHRLEDRALVASFWGTSENNRKAKYYRLTQAGRKMLAAETSRWEQLVRAIGQVMKPTHGLIWPGQRFFRRNRRDEDAAREIASYIAIETDDNIARGMTPQAAHDAAVRKFGNATRVREEIYWMNTVRPVDTIWQDLKYAARLLKRDKGFAAAAILSLALGIGANTAIFQLLDAVRLRSLPVTDPHELVVIHFPRGSKLSGRFSSRMPFMTSAQVDELRKQRLDDVFAGVFAWSSLQLNTATGGEVRNADTLWVSGETFDVLGVRPALGRLITPSDDRPGCGSPPAVHQLRVLAARFRRQPIGPGANRPTRRDPVRHRRRHRSGFFWRRRRAPLRCRDSDLRRPIAAFVERPHRVARQLLACRGGALAAGANGGGRNRSPDRRVARDHGGDRSGRLHQRRAATIQEQQAQRAGRVLGSVGSARAICAAAIRPVGRDRARVADRLRQSCESAAGPRHCPTA